MWSDEAVHEGIVACDEVIPPRCMWSVVTNRVGVRMPFLRDICCTTMFAEQGGSVTVRQAMFNIHVEIVLVENEDEFPNCAVVVFGDWDPVSVETCGHTIDLFPELLPWRSTYFSWFSLFANVAVVYKPRLDVTAVDEHWAPLKDIH